MRIIDIAIPQSEPDSAPSRPALPSTQATGFRSQNVIREYVLEDEESIIDGNPGDASADDVDTDQFYDAADNTTEVSNATRVDNKTLADYGRSLQAERQDIHQKTFEFSFSVGELQASLFRSTPQGVEKPLAAASLSRFDFDFALRKYDMSVDLKLRTICLETLDGSARQNIIDTGSADEDLMKVQYSRVQKTSPEYMTVHDGTDQSIAVDLSTFRIHAQPEPLLALYDFIMTTFVPENKNGPADQPQSVTGEVPAADNQPSPDKLRIRVKLRSFGSECILKV